MNGNNETPILAAGVSLGMGVDGVRITPEALVTQGEEVRRLANDMKLRFESFKETMDKTRGYWIGEAGELHRRLYNEQIEEIEIMIRRLLEHPDDLVAMSENYKAAEKKNIVTAEKLAADIIS